MPNSNHDPELIERIVREVMRRLLDRGVAITTEKQAASGSELQVADRVVGLASLDGKLAGVQRVLVGLRAVVTPAVKDELRDKGIELVRQ